MTQQDIVKRPSFGAHEGASGLESSARKRQGHGSLLVTRRLDSYRQG
jgi:hypothetical protein